ncbi:hypothetical protein GCM10009687_03410 [Asanoa iriomotensis]|uniref:Uncharacterized protein n=1 Tax=Asanoa iriomotensis TaxID=234613 RepID=A0ABQ4C330_9ACTN|nr:hypothetical protein Air01nite_32590 [Asanoa iriomotensis]
MVLSARPWREKSSSRTATSNARAGAVPRTFGVTVVTLGGEGGAVRPIGVCGVAATPHPASNTAPTIAAPPRAARNRRLIALEA